MPSSRTWSATPWSTAIGSATASPTGFPAGRGPSACAPSGTSSASPAWAISSRRASTSRRSSATRTTSGCTASSSASAASTSGTSRRRSRTSRSSAPPTISTGGSRPRAGAREAAAATLDDATGHERSPDHRRDVQGPATPRPARPRDPTAARPRQAGAVRLARAAHGRARRRRLLRRFGRVRVRGSQPRRPAGGGDRARRARGAGAAGQRGEAREPAESRPARPTLPGGAAAARRRRPPLRRPSLRMVRGRRRDDRRAAAPRCRLPRAHRPLRDPRRARRRSARDAGGPRRARPPRVRAELAHPLAAGRRGDRSVALTPSRPLYWRPMPAAARFASALNRSVPAARPGEFRPLVLGPLSVWPPVVLAPMAGVTTYPFRSLCRAFGAGLYVSEMITARGFLEGNARTRLLASSGADERPRSVQVYGSDPDVMGEMARRLSGEGVHHIDMNFGCPAPKITRHGGGSAIPLKPRLMARLVRAAVRGAGGVPVTVKVRKGIHDGLLTYLDAGRVAEEEGAAAIGLHARTAAQLYAGDADWSAIAALKTAVRIPVLGNGDVWECWDALRMLRATGCDGVIVGRGCLRRPWLFAELAAVFGGREPAPEPRLGAIAAIMRDHAERLTAFFGAARGIRQMRKWCLWYTSGFRGAAQLRADLIRIESLDEMLRLLARLDPDEPFPPGALRQSRSKGAHTQEVRLPDGYLAARDDDSPPPLEDVAGWDAALAGG